MNTALERLLCEKIDRLEALTAILTKALEAVSAEITPGRTPYSADSYLPEHIGQQVFAAIALAKGTS